MSEDESAFVRAAREAARQIIESGTKNIIRQMYSQPLIQQCTDEQLEEKLATTCKQEDIYTEIVKELKKRKSPLWRAINDKDNG